jgi:hypothetical protein
MAETYINILHKKLYICGPQTQLTTSLLFQNLTTCFGSYGLSSGDIFEDSDSIRKDKFYIKNVYASYVILWKKLCILNFLSIVYI